MPNPAEDERPSIGHDKKPSVRRQWPAIAALGAGLIIAFVATAFVRDWEVRERRALVAQTSAEHVATLRAS